MTNIKKFKFATLDESYGELAGKTVQMFHFDNGNMTVDITNLGATIVSIAVPDKNGDIADVCLGYSTPGEYLNSSTYFGVVAGRYANRIANGEFSLEGVKYTLNKNDGDNHLHGGNVGFDKRLWDYEIINDKENPKLKLTLISEDMDEGYPGEVTANVIYSLDAKNRLNIEYSATSDKDTIVNLTNHSYFNLNGHNKGDILRHKLYINADKFVRVGGDCIPTGELVEVEGTPFDFRACGEKMHTVGERIGADDNDIKCGVGYDHSFVLTSNGKELIKAAILFEEYNGRMMTVYTNKPGVQLYTGNMLEKNTKGKFNSKYGKRSGLCLETQFLPDSPNHPEFPSCILKANENYNYTTVFEFSVMAL